MARLSFKWIPGQFRTSSLYLVVALIVFGAVVFVLFRGHSGLPQEAGAGDTGPEVNAGGNPVEPPDSVANETQPQPSTPVQPRSLSPGSRRGAVRRLCRR